VAATTTPGATDKTPPAVLLRATSSLKLKSLLKGLRSRPPALSECTLSGRLLPGSTVLGTFTATVNQAGAVNGTLRVSSAGRKALAKRLPKPKKAKKGRKAKTVKPAALVLEVTAVDAVGLKARSSTRVVVAR